MHDLRVLTCGIEDAIINAFYTAVTTMQMNLNLNLNFAMTNIIQKNFDVFE